LELLNLALEAIADAPPFGGHVPGGEELWQKIMAEHAEAATRRKEGRSSASERTSGSGSGAVQDVAMSDA